MTATQPSIDPALFGNLKSGDERAFERLFREWYAALLQEATPLLDGDGASAARGVESVFAQVWKGRAEFTTPDALKAYLHGAVHEAAVRIKSRHAGAHHIGEHGGGHAQKATAHPAPSVDEAWSKVYATLHVNAAHAAEVAHQMADHSRHETAGQLAMMAKPQSWGPIIAFGVIILLGLAGIIWWTRGREEARLTEGVAAPNAETMVTAVAEISNVTLGDGSTVKLGPDSELRIPPKFGVSIRGLKLDGTATFTVAPGRKHRFFVRAGNASIAATGTEFTVRAYPDERDVTVRVREGSVTATAGGAARPLAQGAALVIAKDGAMHEPAAAEIEQSLGWTNGTVVATDVPLREILVLARRWYGLEFLVPDTALLNRKLSFRAKIGSAEEALRSIETSGGLRSVEKGSNVILSDRVKKGSNR